MPKSKKPFVHLHNHSEYSLLDGATSIDRMAELAKEHGMPAVALTDHGNMFGAVAFHDAMKHAGVKPILGCEVYVARESRLKKEVRTGEKHYHHLILLASNDAGYRNLVKLVSRGYTEGFYHKPRIDKELLAAHADGLIALSGCMSGEAAEAALRNDVEAAERAALAYREIMGKENFFLELQDHGIPEQSRINEILKHVGQKHGIPLVVTNDCHFPNEDDFETHQVLLAIQMGRTVDMENPLKYTKEHAFKSSEAMWEKWGAAHAEALENTLAIAERCTFGFREGQTHFPKFEVPDDETEAGYFRRLVKEGFERRKAVGLAAPEEEYEKRLTYEIEVLRKTGFTGYFLVVWDFIRYAKERGIPVGPGRGSVGGSLVSYALGITNIDPLRYGLIFERFINPERASPPDIDIDFCERRRGEVIDYVTNKYGRENVAQVITFGTMRARAVVRDVGRALGLTYGETDRIAKMIPQELGITLEEAAKAVPELRREIEERSELKTLWKHCLKLEGLTRHASIHAAGVVVAPGPVEEYAPLYKSDKDEITTQYAKEAIERVGLLKMDFLGLRTLTVLDDAIRSLKEKDGVEVKLEEIPLDDAETLALFSRGDTYAVFQFESGGMRDILRRLKPDRLEDLIALNALYRPGPIQGGVIDGFIKRRHGHEKADYLIPALEPILRETYGTIVYQEQVIRIATDVAGYTPGMADAFRKAMGKKKREVMADQRREFTERAVARGTPKAKARELFDLVEKFAGYGFNKSHSAAYALLAYWTGWFKVHHPVHYMAATLTSYKGSTSHIVEAVYECREMGIEIVPPDVNRCDLDFTVEGGKILFGLSAVKNVGEKALESILALRREKKIFTSFYDTVAAADLRLCNKKVWESLIRAGALDSLDKRRSQMLAALDEVMARAQSEARHAQQAVGSLFGDEKTDEDARLLPDIPELPKKDLLQGEHDVLGFYIHGSPLDEFRDEIEKFATADSKTLSERPDRSTQSLAGIVRKVSAKTTKKGGLMARVELEDFKGSIEVLVFPDAYEKTRQHLTEGKMVFVKGTADVVTEGKEAKLLAEAVRPIEDLKTRAQAARAVLIETSAVGLENETLDGLKKVFEEHRGPQLVHLLLTYPHRFAVKLDTGQHRVKPSDEFMKAVRGVLGEAHVKLEI